MLLSIITALLDNYEGQKKWYQIKVSGLGYPKGILEIIKFIEPLVKNNKKQNYELTDEECASLSQIIESRKSRKANALKDKKETAADNFFMQLENSFISLGKEKIPQKKPRGQLKERKSPSDKYLKYDTVSVINQSQDNMHPISLMKKKNKASMTRQWYFKTSGIKDGYLLKSSTIREFVATELYRFYVGKSQPEGRIYANHTDKHKDIYFASREVLGYNEKFNDVVSLIIRAFSANENKKNVEKYASILVASLFMGENDLRLGNIGIDYTNTLVKIDHGFSFSGDEEFNQIYPGNFDLSFVLKKSDFDSLPAVKHYCPNNFMSSYCGGNCYTYQNWKENFTSCEELLSKMPTADNTSLRNFSLANMQLSLLTNELIESKNWFRPDERQSILKNNYREFQVQVKNAVAKILLTHLITPIFIELLKEKVKKNIGFDDEYERVFTNIINYYNSRYDQLKKELWTGEYKSYILGHKSDLIKRILDELAFLRENKRYKDLPDFKTSLEEAFRKLETEG